MFFKILIVVLTITVLVTSSAAAEIVFDGHLYTSLRGDSSEGAGADSDTAADVSGDGTPKYAWRYEADVGMNVNIDENTFARLAVTLDDRKRPPLYRYSLGQTGGGDYVLVGERVDGEVYASLEDISITKLAAFGAGDITIGGFDVRYGDGGYYNDFINDIDSNCYVAYLDPYGGRLTRGFGPLSSEFGGGIGRDGQVIFATKEVLLGFDVFLAAEGRAYDLHSLWDVHYASALPGYWRAFYRQTDSLYRTIEAEPGSFGDTIHFGIDRGGTFSIIDYYFIFSYHRYKNSTDFGVTAPTGGSLIQIYPDIGVQIVKPRLWARGALIYQYWKSNDPNFWGSGAAADSDLLLWGEPQFFVRDDMFVGCGFTFRHPSITAPADIQIGTADVESPMSLSVTPHLMYSPAEYTKIDLTFDYSLWHDSYDLDDTDIKENIEKAITLDIEVIF